MSTVRRIYKYRLYPTKAQEQELLHQIELCRQLYNKALWWREGAWRREKQFVTRKEQVHALVQLKRDRPEYANISPGILENVIKRIDLAFQSFFRRCKIGEKPGYPRSKGPDWYKSITVTRSREFKLKHKPGERFGRLSFKGLSNVRVRMHRELPEDANVRRVMVKREANGYWYALFGWDKEAPEVTTDNENAIGIDLGLNNFVATSEGETVASPKHLRRSERKLAKAQRSLSRKRKSSNRRKKARQRVAKIHAKIRDQRKDFLHNASRRLVDNHSQVALEKLTVHNMVKNKHLAKSISDSGWAEFVQMLLYKAESAGKEVILVAPKNTSQACSSCGEIVKKSLSVRTHRCTSCGLVLDRDVNAAINILHKANLEGAVPVLRGEERVAAL
jgi:putative transposase